MKSQSRTIQIKKNPSGPDASIVKEMFRNISGRYDLTNSILSAGTHKFWRKNIVRLSGAISGQKILDCATGTGDLAFAFEGATGPGSDITAVDFCDSMLELAAKKAKRRNSNVRFKNADLLNLPFSAGEFDIVSVAFGIRNAENPTAALIEMSRVARPGGKVIVLEFGQPLSPIFSSLFAFYSKTFLPMLGGLLTGNSGAYDYLRNSSLNFPCGQAFLELAQKTEKFEKATFTPLTGGIAYAYCLETKTGDTK